MTRAEYTQRLAELRSEFRSYKDLVDHYRSIGDSEKARDLYPDIADVLREIREFMDEHTEYAERVEVAC